MTTQNQTAAQPDVAHTPTPWKLHEIDHAIRGRIFYVVGERKGSNVPLVFIADCGFDADGPHTRAEADANAAFIVRACNAYDADQRTIARLREALEIVAACGSPERVSLYDEEAVEGWSWKHPEGNEWTEIGSWDEPPPIHPLARAVLAETKEDKT